MPERELSSPLVMLREHWAGVQGLMDALTKLHLAKKAQFRGYA
jgi:hypothetical protein